MTTLLMLERVVAKNTYLLLADSRKHLRPRCSLRQISTPNGHADSVNVMQTCKCTRGQRGRLVEITFLSLYLKIVIWRSGGNLLDGLLK